MTLYTDPRLTALGVLHGTSDKKLGNMRTAAATAALFSQLHIPEEKILRFKQTHSDRLITIASATQAQAALPASPLQEADGWVLVGPGGFGAAILTADCVPLLLWDSTAQVIGLSHCGWRGVASQLPLKTLQQMQRCGAKGPISAWIGPHIQACCFEVQADVATQFPGCVQERGSHLFVDLNQAILAQLSQAGLDEKQIVCSPHCTCCEPEHFFSFRREHTKDALLTFVYKPE